MKVVLADGEELEVVVPGRLDTVARLKVSSADGIYNGSLPVMSVFIQDGMPTGIHQQCTWRYAPNYTAPQGDSLSRQRDQEELEILRALMASVQFRSSLISEVQAIVNRYDAWKEKQKP